MVDEIQQILSLSETKPEEAAQNIDRANFYDVTPDTYKKYKPDLDKEIEAFERTPAAPVGKNTTEFMQQSEQHSSLAKDDVEKLDWFDKRAKYYHQQIVEMPENNRRIVELSNKKMDEGIITDDETEELEALNLINSEAASEDFGIGETEKLAVDIFSAVGDMGRSYYENKEILAGTVAVGAGAGGLATLGIPVPGARVVGVGAGAIQGLVAGSVAIGFMDGYQMMRGSLYNELSNAVDEKGNALTLDDDIKKNVSHGVAVLSGVATGALGHALVKNNPFLKRFISPQAAAKVVNNPAIRAKLNILGYIAKSVKRGAEVGTFIEFVRIVGDEFGRNIGDVENPEANMEGFSNALSAAFSEKNLERMVKAGAIGAGTAGVVSGLTGAAGYKGLKGRFEQDKVFRDIKTKAQPKTKRLENFQEQPTGRDVKSNTIKEAAGILQDQNNALELAKVASSTKMKEFSPSQMSSFKKKVFSTLGFKKDVWLYLEDLNEFANTPEKKQLVTDILDPSGDLFKVSKELNTPINTEQPEFLDIVEAFPEFSDHMRNAPDKGSAREAKAHLENLNKAQGDRQSLMESFGIDQELTPDQQLQLDDTAKPVFESRQIFNQEEFFNRPAFKEIEGLLNATDVEKFNKSQLNARIAVSESLKAGVEKEFKTIENRIVKDVNEKDIQNEIKTLDKEIKILTQFDRKNISETALELKKSHKKKGFSPYAIDPKSLPEDLRAIYLEDATLGKRKIFVDGGLDVEEAAALANVGSGEELLQILAETPTRTEIIKNREFRKLEIRNRIQQTIKPAKIDAQAKALTDLTKVHLKEMDYMRTREWPALKGTIKLFGKTPKIEVLNHKAKELVKLTKVKDLFPNKYLTGEKRSHRAFAQHLLKNEVEQAMKAKETAAFNSEIAKESLIAKNNVAKIDRFYKKMKTKSSQQTLKDAGKVYTDAYEEITELYNLSKFPKGVTEQKSYDKYVKEQIALGNEDFSIPERFSDVKESAREMTVDQYLTIGGRLQTLFHQAKLKNKLLQKFTNLENLQTLELVTEAIETDLLSHPDYNEKKAFIIPEKSLSITEGWHNSVETLLSNLSSFKTIISQLDRDELNGTFHQLLGDPLKQARTNKRNTLFEIEKRDKKVAEQYGMKKFKAIFNDVRNIPEFKDFPDLGDGVIRKSELMVLMAYMGDPEGRRSIPNFLSRTKKRMTVEEVMKVLNRELDEADALLVQNFLINPFKAFTEKSFELHKKTAGIEPTMVKGVPFEHRGKAVEGGYYPIERMIVADDAKASKFLDEIKGMVLGDEGSFFAKLRLAEMTDQGRLEERTGSDRALDINFDNRFNAMEELAHDLHFREWGIDTLKILKQPMNVKNIKSVIGAKKFTNLLNSTKDIVSKTTDQETLLFSNEYKKTNALIAKAHSLHAVKTIGFNLTSAAIQADSLTTLMNRLGPKSAGYLYRTSQKMLNNSVYLDEFFKIAEEINPDVKFEKDGIDNALIKTSYDFVPASSTFFKKYNKSAAAISNIKEMQKGMIDMSFYFVRKHDQLNRVIATLAVSEQFLNGDVKNWPLERINKLSETEKAKTLRTVVQQAIDLSLTASAPEDKTPIEKNPVGKLFTRYFTDRRNRLTTRVGTGRKSRQAFKEGNIGEMSAQLLWMALMAGVSTAFVNTIRNNDDSIIKRLDKEDAAEFAANSLYNFVTDPVSEMLGDIPGVSGISYAASLEIRSDYRNVNVPLFGVGSDIAMGYVALKDALNSAVKGRSIRLSDIQLKAALINTGYAIGGFPTNGPYKAVEALTSRPVKKTAKALINEAKDLYKTIDNFVELFKDKPEAKDFIEDLREYQNEVLLQYNDDVKDIVPEDTKEVLKESLSEGEWTAYDKETGAAGIYQFTEERWNEINSSDPSLGLTENGRVAKDSVQQEKAMNWSIQDNTRGLLAFDVPITNENLYGAHKFGFDNYIKIYNAKSNEKLIKVLGNKVKDNPTFNNFKTIKSVRSHISNKVNN